MGGGCLCNSWTGPVDSAGSLSGELCSREGRRAHGMVRFLQTYRQDGWEIDRRKRKHGKIKYDQQVLMSMCKMGVANHFFVRSLMYKIKIKCLNYMVNFLFFLF